MNMLKPFKTPDPKAKKYVAFADGTAITFPKNKVHKLEAAKKMSTPISAGFYRKNKSGTKVFGWSDSLQLKPKAGDEYKL